MLYDTLISRLSQDEVVSVVGHELGHWKHMHALYRLVLYVVRIGLSRYKYSACSFSLAFLGIMRSFSSVLASGRNR